MAKITLNISFILILSFLALAQATTLSIPKGRRYSRTRAFVEDQCQTTRYPKLCIHCLSSHVNFTTTQNHQQLANVALKVSLVRANLARVYLIKVARQLKQMKAKEYQIVKDCLDQISDGVTQLSRSVKELKKINEGDENGFVWHQSNVESWASAALTDTLTCMDSFSTGYPMGGKTREIVKAKVLNVAQVTSNALALFNGYVAKHNAASSTKPQP